MGGGKHEAIWGCGCGNKHKDKHTEALVHESSKLESAIHVETRGCRRSDTKQELLAHRVFAIAYYQLKAPCNVVGGRL